MRSFQLLPYRRLPQARWPTFGQRRDYLIPPPPPGASNKLGFSTYAMWALCLVVVGVCYKLEQDDLARRPAEPEVPDDVKKVLPSGMWLMSTLPPPNHVVAPACAGRAHVVHCCVCCACFAGDGSIQKPPS